ncbi:MAG: molybdenum ABC transporter ATP-binding protein [Pseudomonadota bacterium]
MNSPSRILARFNVERAGFALQTQLDLPGRGVTALFGHSGSGKTTLLRAIAGLERHPGGYLEVNGEIWQDDANKLFVPTHRRALGYVFQEASLFPHLSARGNLEFARKRAPSADSEQVLQHALELLGIGHLLERRSSELSGGERQRVAIARALLTRPRLLLMDEPLASLDGKRKDEVLPYLERIHEELDIPMLYVSHSAEEVARLADHVVLLDAGKVIASGPAAETLARLDLTMGLADDAGTLFDGVVDSFDAQYDLLKLNVAGGTMHIAHAALAPGARLRLRILARDVSLALTPQADSSILNHLQATVVAEWPANDSAHVIVKLDAGGNALLARITRRSRDLLALAPGKPVWAQVKTVALLSIR